MADAVVVVGAALLVVVEEVVVPTWKDQPGLVRSAQTFVRVTINSRSHVDREGWTVGVEEGGVGVVRFREDTRARISSCTWERAIAAHLARERPSRIR